MNLNNIQLNLFELKIDESIIGKTIEGFGKTKGTVYDRKEGYVFRVYDEKGNTIFNRVHKKSDNLQDTLDIIKKQYGIQF